MSTLDNILGLLNGWPKWKRITDTPDRVDGLELRIKTLENILKRAPGEACEKCGGLTMRFASSKLDPYFPETGRKIVTYKCEVCAHEEDKVVARKSAQ